MKTQTTKIPNDITIIKFHFVSTLKHMKYFCIAQRVFSIQRKPTDAFAETKWNRMAKIWRTKDTKNVDVRRVGPVKSAKGKFSISPK